MGVSLMARHDSKLFEIIGAFILSLFLCYLLFVLIDKLLELCRNMGVVDRGVSDKKLVRLVKIIFSSNICFIIGKRIISYEIVGLIIVILGLLVVLVSCLMGLMRIWYDEEKEKISMEEEERKTRRKFRVNDFFLFFFCFGVCFFIWVFYILCLGF